MANKNYRVGEARAEQLIDELVQMGCSEDCAELYRQILTTVVKLGREHSDTGDFKLINTALKELRHAFGIFVNYRKIRKAIVFGSSRTPDSDSSYILARKVSEKLVQGGFMVISGAGGGIMEAANRGAGKQHSFGINIKLPFEQKANPYILGDPKLMLFKYFFTRKLIFIKESDATVLLPGGFGTLDEGFENLTLFQTGKSLPRPIVLLEPENGNYWSRWLEFVDSVLVENGYVSPDDKHLFQLATSVEEASSRILQFYRVYHSLRYVRGVTVLRFTRTLPPELLDELNEEFQDILTNGRIRSSPPLDDESRNREYLELPRLVLNFNKRSFGRLNLMIRKINHFFDVKNT